MRQRIQVGPHEHRYVELPRKNCCGKGKGEEHPSPKSFQVVMFAAGIGDNLLGLTSVFGLRQQHPGCRVAYACHPATAPWVRMFYDDLLPEPAEKGAFDVTYSPYSSYPTECATRAAKNRWDLYADYCRTQAVLPPEDAARIPQEAMDWAEPYAGCHVVVPVAAWRSRIWPMSHWRELITMLPPDVVVLDSSPGRCDSLGGRHVIGETPARVAAVIKRAKVVISGDSGMAHLSGLLRSPTLVLCGPVLGERIFGIYPSVKVRNGPLACSGCWWQGPQHMPICNDFCGSLAAILPKDVLAEIETGESLGLLA